MAAGARKTNWFAIWVSVAVVVVLVVVAALVVWMNDSASAPAPVVTPDAAVIDADTGAIVVGDGENTLDTYIDFMCPVCNQFEQVYGEAITGLVEDGTITHNIHPISILDRLSQGTAVLHARRERDVLRGRFRRHRRGAVHAGDVRQPAREGSTGLTNEQILVIAADVGVTGIDACVNDGEYAGFVTAMTEQTPVAPGASGIGTPTIAVNGEVIANSTLPDPANLGSLFE